MSTDCELTIGSREMIYFVLTSFFCTALLFVISVVTPVTIPWWVITSPMWAPVAMACAMFLGALFLLFVAILVGDKDE
mgnify:CR=1 FL=1